MLNKKNNYKYIYKKIAKNSYIYIFINFEIAFLKKFKKNIFDNSSFTDKLYLLAINKIHLVDQ